MTNNSHNDHPKWLQWFTRLVQRLKQSEDCKKRYHKPGWVKRSARLLMPGRVSRIHLYEAQERYLNLVRMVDYHEQLLPDQDSDNKEKNIIGKKNTIKSCREVLNDASVLLTRRQNDLNYLWREMTRVHIMLLERVIPPELLPAQLDFCREDAHRIGVEKNPEVREMLQRLAEVMPDDPNQLKTKVNKEKVCRSIRALIERFTAIRTGQIHQQFINIRTYLSALFLLLPISVALFSNADLILSGPENSAIQAPSLPEFNSVSGWLPGVINVIKELPGYLDKYTTYLLTTNILIFVFLAGLAGGFFSVTTRLRDRELTPGEDAYFVWYVLTKPFVGAVGAAILFVLLRSELVSFEIIKGFTDKLKDPGPVVFGFGFLSGFSERIVFPKFR